MDDYFFMNTVAPVAPPGTDPANETSIALLSIEQPGQKRRRGDINDNNDPNGVQFVLPNINNQSSSSNMDTDIDPPAVLSQPTIRITSSTPTAAASEPTITSTLVQNAIKLSIENYVCDTVRRYGRARLELYSRQVAHRSLLNHLTNNTLPKDLCFNVQTGNPYKKTVPNRDALMAQEQAFLHDAKIKILQQRIEAAKAEEQRLREECSAFQDVAVFKKRFVEEFPAKSLLVHVNQDDCVALYLFHLAEKAKNMDEYCKRKEDSYFKAIQKKQKTTPLTETVNETDFQNNLQDVIYEKIMAFANKYSGKKVDAKSKQPLQNSQQQKNKEKAKATKKSKVNQHSKKTSPSKPVAKPVAKPAAKPDVNITKPGFSKSTTKQSYRQHQSQNQSQRNHYQQSRSYASVVSSSNRRKPPSRVVYEEDDEGWIKVPSKKRVPKNVSSKDPRDVPKRWRK